MAKVGLSITGIKKIDRKLKKLDKEVTQSKKVLRRALREGTKIIQREAQARCPTDEGDLKKSLKVRAGKRSRKHIRYVVISRSEDLTPFYSAFVEFGHFAFGGSEYIAPQPFLRPAYDAKKKVAADFIKQQALKDLDVLIKGIK